MKKKTGKELGGKMQNLELIISKELGISEKQVKNTMALIDEGATVPFISRYRKEVTGSLDEEQIRNILEKSTYIRNLEKRKEEIINSIEEQGELTEELKKKIINSKKLQKLEDLYLPYKKRRKTKADKAIENGLKPLSELLKSEDTLRPFLEEEAHKYINEEVETMEDAIMGAKLIIAQEISEIAEYREYLRNKMKKTGKITSTVIEKNKVKDEKEVFKDYYSYEEKVEKVASHRTMALNRGEKEKILRVKIELDKMNTELSIKKVLLNFPNKNLESIYREIIEDSLKRLVLPSVEREIRNFLTEEADKEAINIFEKNLYNLLMQPPMYEKNILGLDPGFRTGCKVVVINKLGFYEMNDVVYLIMGDKKLKEAKEKLKKIIIEYGIDLIAIGNGTASRETEKFVAELLPEIETTKKVQYIIVSEAGASIYSASKLAREEFPDLDVTVRGAISIARRVQDPLAELVKIDPKSIGVGMYQYDVNQKELGNALTNVVESSVNNVGVNVNSASWALLNYVSGLKKNVCKNIVEYRNENGKFSSRKDLKKIKGLGGKMFTMAAGFIMVPESENPLDNTVIHPESYKIAKELLKAAKIKITDLNENREEVKEKLETLNIEELIKENEYGKETVNDIYNALVQKRRDPRDVYATPLLKDSILKIEDLKEGLELEGTVRNVIKFGAFVDIGLKNDALLHISEFGGKFITDPTTVLAVGNIIKVKIKNIDIKRGRVGLTKKGM